MCYTIQKNLSREELKRRFGSDFKPDRPYTPGKRVSAFLLPDLPVICTNLPDEITTMSWGLIPFWVKNEESAAQIRTKTFNARSESLIEKASFRHTIKNQRCLILSNGFYEWQHQGKEKIPYFIRLKDDIAMPMAGLYDNWTNQTTGEIMETVTIITAAANPLMEKIHNTKKRMPVILHGNSEKQWIDLSVNSDRAIKLLRAFDEKKMLAEKLDEELLIGKKSIGEQGKLF